MGEPWRSLNFKRKQKSSAIANLNDDEMYDFEDMKSKSDQDSSNQEKGGPMDFLEEKIIKAM